MSGQNTEGAVWDGRAAYAVGKLIREWIEANPPPKITRYAADLATWSDRLVDRGERDLKQCGATLADEPPPPPKRPQRR